MHPDTRACSRLRITGPDGVERDAELGMELGPLWATWWLDVSAEVPEAWAGSRVDLLLVTNSEATVWVDGEPVQGLVSGAGRDRIAATLVPSGGRIAARVEIACNGLFGWAELNPPSQRPEPIPPAFRLERCEIARFDPDAWALACDLGVLSALMDEEQDAWGGELLRELNRVLQHGRPRDPHPAAGAPQRHADARDHRDRPRAHRHRLAVAARGDLPQVRAFVRDPAAADGALPGLPLRVLAGAAVRVDPRS